ncbi:MAG: hypothetical protein QOI46_3211, partial [Alphaproteobacteria bacterium]|nr:hypothetical protein [Alphaproteobacteria bacterium]
NSLGGALRRSAFANWLIAVETASETVSICAKQGYRETAVVLDADGALAQRNYLQD